MKKAPVVVYLSTCAITRSSCTALAFRSAPRTMNPRLGRSAASPPTTMLHAVKVSKRERIREKIESMFEGANTFEKRQKIREEIEDLEEADFLYADVKPKALVHERDYFRQSTRMEAWEEYVLVSILCTSISYGALQAFQLNPDHQGIYLYETIVKTAIQIVAGFGVLCGLYSTMVYSLSILYGKTALGLERDPQYDAFLDKTQGIRDTAFLAFSFALAFFSIIVVLVLSESLPLVMHLPVGAVMLGALYIGFRDWKTLVDCAEDIYDFLDDD